MKPRKSVAWLGVGAAIFAGFGGVPAVAGGGVEEDPFAVLEVVGEADLEAARGGGVVIINDDGTQVTALNEITATIGTMTITAGSISGGPVTFSDNALGSFSGLLTQAFATAPGSIATATTALTITLIP